VADHPRPLEAALSLALQFHAGQDRRGRSLPVIAHIIEVVGLLINAGVDDPGILASAALHDSIEDASAKEAEAVAQTIQEQLGPEVLQLVTRLTKPHGASKETRHEFMIHMIRDHWQVALIKLADRTSNIANFHVTEWKEPNKRKYLEEAQTILRATEDSLCKAGNDIPLGDLEAMLILRGTLDGAIKEQMVLLEQAEKRVETPAPIT
jgi:(p)ppGpp synthase/HD superfamily hydrolase